MPPPDPGRWQLTQCAYRIGATSVANVGARCGVGGRPATRPAAIKVTR